MVEVILHLIVLGQAQEVAVLYVEEVIGLEETGYQLTMLPR